MQNFNFRCEIERLQKNSWSFGVGLTHCYNETYLFVNFFKWEIFIGKMMIEEKE